MHVQDTAALPQHMHSKGDASVGRGQEAQADPVGDARQRARRLLVVALVPVT